MNVNSILRKCEIFWAYLENRQYRFAKIGIIGRLGKISSVVLNFFVAKQCHSERNERPHVIPAKAGIQMMNWIPGNIDLWFHSIWQWQIRFVLRSTTTENGRIWGWLHRFWRFAIPFAFGEKAATQN